MCAISSLTSTFAISSPDEFLYTTGISTSIAGLKVRGREGSAPQLLAHPQLREEWGGRLRMGIRERGKWCEGAPPQLFQTTLSSGLK